jgi:hypothetical protein
MSKTKFDFKEYIDKILLENNKKYGNEFASYHEMYAVLKEEAEEANEYLGNMEYNINLLWDSIRKDRIVDVIEYVKYIYNYANGCMNELLEVQAICKKYLEQRKNLK